MKELIARSFALWVPIVVATSGLFVFAYWAVQQSYRLGANDPQIQVAEDAAAALNSGAVPAALVSRSIAPIDIAMSLAPWITIYDSSGTPLESSAVLDGAPPRLPAGVFDANTWKPAYAAYGVVLPIPKTETRFSWQPRSDVRQAVVLVRANNGYFVATGRNIREVENRIELFTKGAALLWGGTELATLVAIVILLSLGWL